MPYGRNKAALDELKISMAATDNDISLVYRNAFVTIRALFYKFTLK